MPASPEGPHPHHPRGGRRRADLRRAAAAGPQRALRRGRRGARPRAAAATRRATPARASSRSATCGAICIRSMTCSGWPSWWRCCAGERPDLVHVNSSKAAALGRVAAVAARTRVRVFTVHGWAFKAYDGLSAALYRWADRLLAPLTTVTICVSETERAAGLAARTCRPTRTVVIPNAVDVERAPRAPLAGDPPQPRHRRPARRPEGPADAGARARRRRAAPLFARVHRRRP